MISSAHISISTADHEFFGVSMVEAAQVGCCCLVPNRLRNVFIDLIFSFFFQLEISGHGHGQTADKRAHRSLLLDCNYLQFDQNMIIPQLNEFLCIPMNYRLWIIAYDEFKWIHANFSFEVSSYSGQAVNLPAIRFRSVRRYRPRPKTSENVLKLSWNISQRISV